MKSYWKSLLFILITFTTTIASAQENCSDGVDNDGDGLIDCYDGDCSDDGACDDFFFGNTVICADDIDVTTFAIREQWGSEDETATSHVTPAIGDLDGNGIPEVVSVNNYGSLDLFVLNGATGATIASADIGFTPENAPVIAEVDGDEIGDIIVSQNRGDDLAMYNVDIATGTLTLRWRERASVNQSIGLPGVADFDEDGDVEIYYRNEVMDARTGTVIIAGDGDWKEDYTHGSIAVDVLPDAACADCAGLELVSGNEIWAINEAAGTRTLVEDMDDDIHDDIDPNLNYYPKYYSNWNDQWSTVSAADYNLDGNIDLIMTGALGTASEEYNGETTIFFWDVANQNVITYHDPTNNFVRGPGRVNIGDVDGDGQLNANFVMDQKLYSLDENFNVHWIHPIKEGSSGFTGCSLFDFDGDGAVEVVYRSEESLLIVDGVGNGDNTTNERNEIACVSRTQEEYPVIADVDGDGSSEICVSCYTNNSTPFSPYSNTQFSQVRVYESDGEAWMPARGVWNQHGYYNVNINDDLTVPTEVQDHSVVFSLAGSCEYSDGSTIPFDNRPLNTFLNQAPILNEEGCVEFASPDIEFVGILSATDALCPDAAITVEYEIRNQGDIAISGSLPVSYYAGDPRTADGVLLDTEIAPLVNFDVGEVLTITQTFTGIGGNFELFVVINDNGGTPPITVPLPTATIPECETGNNIQSTIVGFQTFDLSVEKIFDNRKCADTYVDEFGATITVPNNGEARAYYFGPTPGANETFWIENFEDRSNGDQSDTDDTGWTSDPGTNSPSFYGVATYNGSKMFNANNTGTSNDVGIVTWTSEDIDISGHTDINVSMDIFENGNQESSGQWRDFVRVKYELRDRSNAVSETGQFINGFQVGDFTYNQAFLSNLNSDGLDSIMVITVEIHNTSSSEYHYIDNISINGTGPDVLGEFTEPDGFNFYWFATSDTDYSDTLNSTSTFAQMPTGTYNVVGFYQTTQCYSDTVEVEILQTTPEVYVWAYEISPLTLCNTPDGSVGAFVYTQTEMGTFPANATDNRPLDTLLVADGYQFNWRDNDDITNTVFATGNVISNLLAKEFAVDVIDLQTRCTNTALVEVTTNTENVTDPNVAITHITSCGGTGELSADVDGNTADFTFEWYDGTGVKPAADFTGATYTVTTDGDYTVVATNNTSGCLSDPVTVTLNDNSVAPDPGVSLVQNNTSCVAGNGIVSADGDGSGTVSGFTFEWFLGANTLPANALPGTAAPGAFLVNDNPYQLGGLEEATYTVRVTEISTSCFKTRTINVSDTPGSLTVTPGNLVQNNINSCDVAILGSIDASGVVPGSVTNVSIGNLNSSFENLDIITNNDHVQSFDGGTIKTYLQDFITGWSTTASDQRIEIWHNNNTQGHDAFHGDQFAEINANETAALYFDLATVPGSLLNWSFAHKGRSGTDVLSVNIGEPGAEISQGNYSTGNTAWSFYEGQYTIPVDQFTTRFQFEAVSTAGGNNSIGNFVDTVSFVLFPYRFELYQGATVSGSADFINTTGVFNDLNDGDYVLVVYDNLTGCGAVEIPITITRSQDQPTIAAVVTDDANCDTDAGSVDITSSMPTTEPGSYTYELFDGHSFTTQIGPDETIADGSIPFTFSNLAPGDYRIRVTNDDTQCTNFEDIIVDDITVIPTFSTSRTVVDNSSCDPAAPNGFLSVTIQGDSENNYLFTWYDGNSSGSPVLTGPTIGDNDLSNLDAGDYTVVAENIATGCETVELTLNIADDPYIPNIVISEDSPQTDCGTGNGVLSAYVDNNPDFPPGTNDITGFTFQWQLDGVDLTDGVAAANGSIPTGSQTATVSGLIADEYTLVVTHTNTDCPATESFVLSENQTIPVISLTSTQANTGCATTTYDGEILISVAPAGTYDFDWFYSDGTQVADGGTVSGSSTNNLTGVMGDTYKVVATSTLLCTSDTLSVLLADNLATISVNGTIDQQLTVCVPSAVDPNGQITVTPTTAGGEPTGGYNIQWYFGSGTSNTLDASDLVDGDALGTSASAAGVTTLTTTGLEAGTYTVQVINVDTQCPVTEEFTIVDNSTDPTFNNVAVDVTPVHMTDCDGGTNYPNGGVAIDLSAITGSGNYTVNYFYGGTDLPANQLTVDGTTNIFTEKGIAGTANLNITETTDGTTAASVTGLNPGDYTIVVIDDGTGCTTAAATITVNATPAVISVNGTIDQQLTVCVPSAVDPNGQITVTPTTAGGEPTGGYNIQWYFGSGTSNTLDASDLVDGDALGTSASAAGVTTLTTTGLEAGTYTVQVINVDTQCPVTEEFTIVDNSTDPTFNNVAVDVTPVHMTDCDGGTNYPNGGVAIDLSAITGSGNYTVNYFYGGTDLPANQLTVDGTTDIFTEKGIAGTANLNITETTDGTTAASVTGLNPGDYTIVVIDDGTGCTTAAATVTVNATPAVISVNGTIDQQLTVCVPSAVDPNGQITVTPTTAGGEPTGGYNIQWYFGSGTSNTLDASDLVDGDALGTSASAAGVTTLTTTGLEAGTYTVQVINVDTQCPVTEEFTIVDNSTDPTFNNVAVDVTPVHMTDCDGGTNYPNGGVAIDLSAITGSGNYTVNYFYGGTDLPANQLTVDGTTDIFTEKGIAGTANLNITETTDGTTAASVTGLNPGDYTIVVIDDGTGCTTAAATVTVNATPAVISVNGTIDQQLTVCVPSAVDPNGQITVTPTTAGGEPTGGYNIQWYFGSGTSNTLDASDLVDGDALGTSASAAGVTTLTTTGLEAGTYTVQVINVDTQCPVTEEFTIVDNSTDPTFNNVAVDVTPVHMTDCDGGTNYPNGGVAIDLSAITGSGNYTVNYFYGGTDLPANQLTVDGTTDIFTEKGIAGTANLNITETTDGTTAASVTGLNPGDYTIVVIDDGTGCTTAAATVTVNATPAVISVNGTIDQQLTVCVPSAVDPNGQITVTPTTAGGEPTGGYNIQWYFGSGTSNTLDASDLVDGDALGTSASAAGVTTLTTTGLEAGTYTVQVINVDTQCPVTEEFTIVDNSTDPTFNNVAVDVTPVHMTDCDGGTNYPNGGVAIDLSAITGSGNYTVNYFYGGTDLPANQLTVDGTTDIFTEKGIAGTANLNITETTDGTTAASVTGLNPGDYTIVVIDDGTGCTTAAATVTVNATPAVISVNGTIDQQLTVCVPSAVDPNGQITVTPTTAGGEPTGGYNIQWYFGSGTSNTLDASDLVDGDALGTSASAAGVTTLTTTGLEAGTYTVQVINVDTQCPVTEEFTIVDNSTDPTFNNVAVDVTPVHMTDCDGGTNYPNGGVAIDLSAITGSGNYTVNYFYGGTDLPANQLTVDGTTDIFTEKGIAGTANLNITETTDGTTAASVTGLNPGDYTIVVIDDGTGCTTAAATVTVNATPAVISVNGTIDQQLTVCVPSAVDPNGQITVTPTTAGGEPTGGYNIQWYFGSGTSNTLDASDLVDGDALGTSASAAGVTTLTTTGLEAGTYTVQVINVDTQCPVTEEFTIVDNSTDPTFNNVAVDVTPVHMTDCDGGTNYPNGGVAIDLSAITGSGNYTVNYFYGGTDLPANQLTVDGTTDIFTEKSIAGTANLNITETTDGTTAASVTGLNPGDYTIVVIDDGTGCTTAAATVTVNATPAVISVNGTIDQQLTVCVPSAVDPNGQITVTPTTAGGEPTGGYNIQWYFGSGTSNTLDASDLVDGDALGTSASAAGVTTLTTTGLEAGTYTVQVINVDTQCPVTEEFTIVDNSTDPTFNNVAVDVTPVHMTDCDGGTNYPNGGVAIDLSAITGSGNYTVNYFYGGTDLPANQLTVDGTTDIFTEKGIAGTANLNITETTDGTTAASVTGLNPGDYTIVVIDDGTGCTTAAATVTVNATPITFTPAITITSNQTSCDLSSPNGRLTGSIAAGASVDPNDYSFRWFTGQNTNSGNEILAGLSGTNNSVVSNLSAGIYTLLVTENNSNCFYSVEETIVLDNENPNFALGVVSVNTSCSTPDGSIAFTVDPDGDSDGDAATSPFDGAAGYNVELFEGATIGVGATPLASLTATDGIQSTFTGLLDNTYSIRATDLNTNCIVEELGIVVSYTGVTLALDPSLFFEQNISACFDNDGIIDIGTGMTVNNDYINGDAITIEWYAGTDTSDATTLLSNLHNVNPAITVPIDMQDITIADGDGDNITVVNGRIGDNPTAATSGLPAISYTGVATLPNGCIEVFSTSLTFGAAPVVTIASVDPTRCATTFDGQISITLDAQTGNNPAQYRYYVFEGSQSIQPDSDGATPFDPALSTYTPIAVGGAATGLFTDATDDATELIDFNDNVALGQLEAGTYTIGVDFFDGGLGDNCIVFVGTVTLVDPGEPSLTLTSSTNNSICDVSGGLNYNGQITVDRIVDAAFPGNFDFTWYEDLDDNGTYVALLAGNGSGAGLNVVGQTATGTSTTVTGLSAGKYRVIGIHDAAGGTACPDTLDIELFDEPIALSVGNSSGADWDLSNIENCTDLGAFTLMRILQNGAVDAASDTEAEIQTDFTLVWNNLTTASTFVPNVSETESNNLAAGDYRIDITSDLTGCITSYQFTILDNTLDPVISLNTDSDDTFCDGTNNIGDGSVTIDITEDGGAAITLADYSIEWYRGTFTTSPTTADANFLHDDAGSASGANVGSALVGGDIRTLTGLEAGTYTVFITKDNGDASGNGNEGCSSFATFTIGTDQPVLTVNLATGVTVVNNDNCSPADGSITIDEIIIDGVATPLNNASPYTINWTAPGAGVVGTSNAGVSIANDQLTGVNAGTYSFTITHNTTACATATIDVVVEDIQVDPVISLNTDSDDTSCDGTNNIGDGSVTIDITEDGGAAITLADYSIEWYRGTFTTSPTTADANFLHDDAGSASGANVGSALVGGDIRTLTGLEAGTYTVFITKDNGDVSGNGNEGCSSFATFTIGTDQPVLTVNLATGVTVVNNDNCSPADGSITIDEIIIDGVATPLNNASPYTINWTAPGAGVVGTSNAGVSIANDQLTGVNAGTYSFTITHNTTACATATIDVVVEDIQVDPVISLNTDSDDTFCDGTNNIGDGSVTIDITEDGGAAITLADYSIEWYRGTFTTSPTTADANFLHDDAGSASGANVGSALVGGDIRTLTGLEAGTYTVFITKDNGDVSGNGNEGCSSFATFTIGTDQPVLTVNLATGVTVVNNDNCSPADGSITIDEIIIDGVATPLNNASPYTINWTAPGAGVVGTSNAGVSIANDQLTGVNAGTYSFTITHNTTACATATIDVVVEDIQVDPVISLNTDSDDTFCDGTNNIGDGSVTIDITEDGGAAITLADYSIEWYRGTFTTSPTTADANFLHDDAGSASGANVGSALVGGDIRTLTGLEAGTYTVFITKDNGDVSGNGNEGCSSFATFTIGTDQPVLTVNLATGVTVVNNDNCSPADGSITIDEIIIDGVATPLNNASPYTINWTAPGAGVVGTSNAGVSIANDQLTGVNAGTYSFTITHNTTACATATIDVVVEDIQVDPVISLNTDSDDTFCDGTNNIGDGSVTIDITEDGGAAITLADYSIEWYRGTFTTSPTTADANFLHDDAGSASGANVGSALVGGDIRTLTGLEAGTYTVFITKDNGDVSGNGNEGCSSFATFTIGTDQPVLTVNLATGVTVVNNDNCSPADGSITIDEIIIDGVATPLNNASPYTINWTAPGAGVVGTSNAGVSIANDQLTGVNAGTYSFTITHNTTACATATIDVVVEDIQVDPVISLNTDSDDTFCDGTNNIGDGSVTIDITEDGGAAITLADYSIEWYRGTFTTSPTTADANFLHDDAGSASGANVGSALVGGDIRTLTGLEAGTYTVFITKDNGDVSGNGNEGCSSFATFTIGTDQPVLTVNLATGVTVVNNDNCSPADGSITIDEIIIDGVATPLNNASPYTINWTAPGAGVVGTSNAGVSIANDQLTGVNAGTYSFTITHNTTACATATIDVVVEDIQVDPVISLNTDSDDTFCDGTNNIGDGSVTIDITEDGGAAITLADYSIEWYRGTFTTSPTTADANFLHDDAGSASGANVGSALVGGDIRTLTGLEAGTYTVFITKDNGDVSGNGNEGCSSFATFTIGTDQPVLTVNLATGVTVVNNDNCSPADGSITIDEIIIDGVATPLNNASPYTINWTAPGAGVVGTSNAGVSIANDQLTGVNAGTYSFTITHNTTACATATIDVVVEDIQVDPVISLNTDSDDTFCDGTNNIGDGSVTIDITEDGGAAITLADYSIEWYRGTFTTSPTTADANFLHDDAGSASGANVGSALVGGDIRTLTGLEAGTYTVFITKDNGDVSGNGNEGCSSFATFTIGTDQPVLTVNLATGVTVVNNDNCSPADGSITIDEIIIDGVATPLNNASPYTINWTAPGAGVVGTSNAGVSIANDQLTGVNAGTYSFTITHNTTACATATIDVVVEDLQINPIISGTSTEDTYCDNTGNVGDGSLSISIEDDGVAATATDFTITWYRGTIAAANEIFPGDGGTRGSATANGTLTALSDLATGDYTVVINKDLGDTPGTGNLGCTATAVYNVGSMDNIPTLDETAIQARTEADTLCIGNSGTLIVNDADVSTGDLSDFEIQIRQGSATGSHLAGSPFTNPAATSISFTNLAADDYFVIAENTTTGCIAATAIINVKDSVRNPQVTLVSMTPDQDCGGGVDAGGLEVLVDGLYDHTNQTFLTFLWEISGGGAVGVTDNEAVLTGVAADDYQVTVTNTNTNCSITRTYTITNVPINPSISDFIVTENNICDDDGDGNPVDVGSFELTEATFDGNTLNQAAMTGNYRLEVYDDFALGSPTTDGDGDATNFIYTELGAGTYFAIVRKLDSDCISDPLEFEVIDNVLRPVVSISLQTADSTCAVGGTPNGSLRATATVGTTSGIDDTDPDYTFQWYLGSGTGSPLANGVDPGNGSTPAGVFTSDISGLAAGTYTVEVTRISTGCVTLEEFELPNVPTNVEIMTVAVVDATNCTPGNGTITVTGVNRDNVTDYNFDYYDTDPTSGSPTPVFTGNAGAAYTTASAGVYYIIGTNTIVNCTTPIFEIEVGENLTFPSISLDDFDFQTNCDPSNPNGRLLVLADGQPENATYDFEWYFGTGTTDPLTSDDYTGGGNLTGASTNEVSGLAAGIYTVEVTNNVTGCVSTETYEMTDNIPNPIAISTSTSDNTSCTTPNGKAAVSVITLAPGRAINDYSYYWFIGDLATVGSNPNPANADYTGTLIEGITDGDYVVYVVDQIDNFCQSEAIQVTVQDGTSKPSFTLTTSDVTVCFDVKDGFASVSVPDISTVDIQWLDDTNTPIGTEFFVDNLDAGAYSLVLTHVVTGCVADTTFNIINNAVTPSDPFVLVNNGRNNCQFANGSAIANVDGVTNNFLFEWFDPTDMNTPYATGSEVFNLDTTTYLVRATNLATGCESAFTSVDIGYEVVDPVYEIVFNNSVCLRTEDGSTNQFTGTAIVSFEEFQLATDYEWRDESGTIVGTDSRLIDAYPGNYTVTFTAENGCSYSGSFTIETSLTIYNGVSANADGKNDFFLIDCIDYFPNNNLKIFNRAGQKVYDIDGYNNTSIRFEGISNVGGGGLKLPSGTYFYIIDLGNGEDPVQGYLELVR